MPKATFESNHSIGDTVFFFKDNVIRHAQIESIEIKAVYDPSAPPREPRVVYGFRLYSDTRKTKFKEWLELGANWCFSSRAELEKNIPEKELNEP